MQGAEAASNMSATSRRLSLSCRRPGTTSTALAVGCAGRWAHPLGKAATLASRYQGRRVQHVPSRSPSASLASRHESRAEAFSRMSAIFAQRTEKVKIALKPGSEPSSVAVLRSGAHESQATSAVQDVYFAHTAATWPRAGQMFSLPRAHTVARIIVQLARRGVSFLHT